MWDILILKCCETPNKRSSLGSEKGSILGEGLKVVSL